MRIEKSSKSIVLGIALWATFAATSLAQNLDDGIAPIHLSDTLHCDDGAQPIIQPTSYANASHAVDDRRVAEAMPAASDCDPKTWTIEYGVGYESFRGIADGSWTNNGIVNSLNFGTSLGSFSDYTGIGLQMGGRFGIYDWSGTDYRLRNDDQAETQAFFTAGFFRKPHENSPYSAAVVYDVMLNNNYSVFAQSPTLSQWRGLVGYELNDRNEFGFWGTLRDRSATWNVNGFGPVTWRSINEVSMFWHYKWTDYGADTMLSVGLPEQDRLYDGGSLGDYLVVALAQVPLNDRFNLVAQVSYMHPSTKTNDDDSSYQDAWSFYIGMTFFPRSDARTRSVANEGWSPLLPVCDNGSFLVDASQTY